MKRRDFIRKTGLAAASAIAIPYILPSGRLFAATGLRKANYVVFCIMGGGIRNIETVQKAEGNLMSNLLNGNEAVSNDIAAAMDALPSSPLPMPLQNYGTLFSHFKYAKGPTSHFNAHTCALTGIYTGTKLNTYDQPQTPTIFELYNKHNSLASATDAWFISSGLGPYPALSHSNHILYGSPYKTHFISPSLGLETETSTNHDLHNIIYAEDIIKRHQPGLMVVNMQDADICHTSFTSYCNAIRKADYAVAHLWNEIQNTPGMKDDTILIVAPDHGRDLNRNQSIDIYGRYSLDHNASIDLNGDQTARDIFCLVVGPPDIVKQGQVIDAQAGETIEIAPTIAHILGFEKMIPKGMLKSFSKCDMQEAFV